MSKKEKRFKVPHVYVLLSILIIIAFILTFVVPSGEYARIEDPDTNRIIVQADSYQRIDKDYLNILDLPLSIVGGMLKSANVIFFVLLIGGAFKVITDTKVFDALTAKIALKYGKRENLLIPIFVIFFSILGFTMGSSQEVIIFVPIGIAVARALGFDAITGVAMMQLGAMCGFTAGLFNPFNVGVAQGIAGLELYSGLWLRVIILIVISAITIAYIMRYAMKVKANPQLSLSRELELAEQGSTTDFNNFQSLTKTHVIIMITLVAGFSLLIWGVKQYDWFINEMSAIFISLGIICGLIANFKLGEIADKFVEGAKALTFGAIIIGLATAIVVVMEKGLILDTMVNGIFNMVSFLPGPLQAVGIYFSQIFINFFIISGTGQAAVVMPILLPLGDLLDISRQTLVLAFQLGDGFTNSFFPTSATLMAVLSVAKVDYDRWFKFTAPLMIILTLVAMIFVYIASVIGYA